jgi:GNAT superfamily N-acetyltransferase
MASFEAVPFRYDEHIGALRAFLARVYPPEKVEARARVIQSMHQDMPEREREPLRHVILDRGRVAASMGHLPADFHLRGRRVRARYTHDLLVDSDYRGKGLAKIIVAHARGVGGFMPGGMWMTDPCYRLHLACGFSALRPITTYNLVLNVGEFLERKDWSSIKKVAARSVLAFMRLRTYRALDESNRASSPKITLETLDHMDPDLDASWEEMTGEYGATRLRLASHINWKYARHPHLSYRIIAAHDGTKPRGYLIWRPPHPEDPDRRAVVADFLVRRGDARTFASLLMRAVAGCLELGSSMLSLLTTQSWAAGVLRRAGFLPKRPGHPWVISGWEGVLEPSWLENRDAWHVCLGDSDGDLWSGCQ